MKPALQALFQLYRQVGRLERGAIVVSLVTAAATILSSTGLMTTSAYLISYAALQPSIADIMVTVTSVRFFGLARAGFRYTERMVSHQSVFKLLSRLRVWIFKTVVAKDGKDLLKLKASDLFTLLSSDIESLQDFYLRTFMPLGTALLLSLIYTTVLAFYDLLAAGLFLTIYAMATVGLAWVLYRKTAGLNAKWLVQLADYKTAINDFTEGQADLLTNGRLPDFAQQLANQESQLVETERAIARWRIDLTHVQQFLVHLSVFASLLIALGKWSGETLPGVLLAAMVLPIFTLYEAAPNVLTLFQKAESSGNSAARINQLDSPVESDDLDSTESDKQSRKVFIESIPDAAALTLRLENISAGYGESSEASAVLKQITLTIKKGQRIGIVGESGSGKSTLSHVLTGLLNPSSGTLTLQTPTADLTLSKCFAVVDQQLYLFNRTLRDNLLLGDVTASDETLLNALSAAGIPLEKEALDEFMGLSGNAYSGGERQRIALARALLKQAPFLLLDEATAGLDFEKESEILLRLHKTLDQTAAQERQGLVLITHRLLHMDRLDCLYVFEKGHLIESGSHDALLAQGGLYAQMWAVQEDRLQ